MQWWNWAGMDKELNPVSDLCQFSAAITTHRIRLLLHFSASKMILLYYRATKTFTCTASLLVFVFFVEGRKREDVKVLVLSICCQTWGVHKESWCILGILLDVHRGECRSSVKITKASFSCFLSGESERAEVVGKISIVQFDNKWKSHS